MNEDVRHVYIDMLVHKAEVMRQAITDNGIYYVDLRRGAGRDCAISLMPRGIP